MSEKVDAAYETAEMSGDYRVLCDLLLEDNQRLQAALREIAACPQKRHLADGGVDVYYNGATMLKIAREALGMDTEDAALIEALQKVHDKEALTK